MDEKKNVSIELDQVINLLSMAKGMLSAGKNEGSEERKAEATGIDVAIDMFMRIYGGKR